MRAGARIEQRPGRLPSPRKKSLGARPGRESARPAVLSRFAREHPLELVARAARPSLAATPAIRSAVAGLARHQLTSALIPEAIRCDEPPNCLGTSL
jgi:hypothetical protein